MTMTENGTPNNLPETPLGLNSSLLTHHPLGQKFIAPKFIQPLGAINISFVNNSIIQGILIDDIFQQQKSQTSSLIQHKALTPPSLQTSFSSEKKVDNTPIKTPEINKDISPEKSSLQKASFPNYDTSYQPQAKKTLNTNQSPPDISRRSHKTTEIFRSIITSSNPQGTTNNQLNPSFETNNQSPSSTIEQKNKKQNTSSNPPLEYINIQKKYSLNTNKQANDPLQLFRRKSQKKETIQAKANQHLQPKIPEQWSSIEELIGETTLASENPTPSIQRTEAITDSSSTQVSNNPTPSVQRTEEITDSADTQVSENPTQSVQRTEAIPDSSGTLASNNPTPSIQRTEEPTHFASENSTPFVQRTEETTDSSGTPASNNPTPSVQRTEETIPFASENSTPSVQRTEEITPFASNNPTPSIQRTEAIPDSAATQVSNNPTPSVQRTEAIPDSAATQVSNNPTPSIQRTEAIPDSSGTRVSENSTQSVQRIEAIPDSAGTPASNN
ncbi:hypothetical protein PN466_17025, partial [Roseofilum reptotaenium CS-1145]|uniref:hypothetical protein n=1 Tax=Roseofilum reptotaenium TaxID=1233427 RepID=UPI0028BEB720